MCLSIGLADPGTQLTQCHGVSPCFKLSTSSLTLGLIIAGGLALSNVASASESEAFSMKQLAHGYSQAQTDTAEKPAEGKCGEGKCGASE